MNSSQFRISQLKYLASLTRSTPDELEFIINNIDDYYKEWIETKIDSKKGTPKTYSDGTVKTRIIRPPKKRLKEIQRAIKINILSKVPLPSNIHGGVKGKANYTNAKAHKGKKFKFGTDLKDFFPSVTNDMVYKAFCSLGYSKHLAEWLTKLTTWKYELPQGAPTSTHLANIVFLKTDRKLIELSNANDITYTRFVDDLTFSSQNDFKPLLDKILCIVTGSGFKISFRKTSYNGNQNITGIILRHNYLKAPDKIIQKAKEEEKKEDRNFKPYTNYLNNIKKANKK